MKIKHINVLTAVILGLLFCAVNVLLLNKFYNEKNEANKNYTSITASSILNKATIELSLERSVTQATLSLSTPISDDFKTLLLSQRVKSEEGFDKVYDLVKSSNLIDRKNEFLDALKSLRKKINQVRIIADRELAIPKEGRTAKNISDLPDTMKSTITSFSNLSIKLISEDSYIPPFVSKLKEIQSLAWSIREFGGRERTYLAVASATGEKIHNDLLIIMANYHKKAENAMDRIELIAGSSSIEHSIKDKINNLITFN